MTFPDVISKWPNAGVLAKDINANRGTVKQWRRRQNIPPEYWLEIESAARRRGIEGVTVFTLAEIAKQARPAVAA